MNFSIHDLLWVTFVVAMTLGWWWWRNRAGARRTRDFPDWASAFGGMGLGFFFAFSIAGRLPDDVLAAAAIAAFLISAAMQRFGHKHQGAAENTTGT